jgi:UDP-N-acetylmuramate--alanine ligase
MLVAGIEDPIHFIGIGGTGMAGLAELACRLGYLVQGSDIKSSPMTDRLSALGVKVTQQHHAADLGQARTIVYSSAIGEENVELVAARTTGLKTLHRSDFLNFLMKSKRAITIAGTHGKSTTSAMIAHVLDDLGADPWAATGGVMLRYDSTARQGGSDLFVAEADESDGSFLKYRPFIAILTNVECDHMDFFKNEPAMLKAFAEYLNHTDPEGCAIIGWDHPRSREIGLSYTGKRLTYGFLLGSEVRAIDYVCKDGSTHFTAIVERDRVKCVMPTMGRHNVQNALCTLAVARSLELDVTRAASSLSEFRGVARRMDRIFSNKKVVIFDDYAHNPGKIAAGVKALKETFPNRKLHVVYQPHRFSRLETMYNDMLVSLKGADNVYVVPVYSAGESTSLDFSPARLARDLSARLNLQAWPCESLTEAAGSVLSQLKGDSVILTVGAGDVWRVAVELKEALE